MFEHFGDGLTKVLGLRDVITGIAAGAASCAVTTKVLYRWFKKKEDADEKTRNALIETVKATNEEIKVLKDEIDRVSPIEALKRADKDEKTELYHLVDFLREIGDDIAAIGYRLGKKQLAYALANKSSGDLREAERFLALAHCIAPSNNECAELHKEVRSRLLGSALTEERAPADANDLADWLNLQNHDDVGAAITALISEVVTEIEAQRFVLALATARAARDLARQLPADDLVLWQAKVCLAKALSLCGSYEEAEPIARETWKCFPLPSDHAVTAIATVVAGTLLMEILNGLGCHGEVESLASEVAKKASILPADHPQRWGSRRALAFALRDLGRHDEAEAVIRAMWNQQQAVLPQDHKFVLVSAAWLASILQDQCKYEEAEKLLFDTWERMKSSFPADDLLTLKISSLLSMVWNKLGRNIEAEPIARDAWKKLNIFLPASTAEVMESALALAAVWRDLGRDDEAESIARGLWEQRKTTSHAADRSGRYHLSLLGGSILASILTKLGRNKEAEAIARETWEREKALRPGSYHTVETASVLASILRSLGRNEEATAVAHELHGRTDAEAPPNELMTRTIPGTSGVVSFRITATILDPVAVTVTPSPSENLSRSA
jgi:tetratricopeptide (TPR) repeat protein